MALSDEGRESVGRLCRGTGALSGESGVSLVPFQNQNAKDDAWNCDKTLDANEARVRCCVCKETRVDVCQRVNATQSPLRDITWLGFCIPSWLSTPTLTLCGKVAAHPE
jgi:hypothetical protein